MNFEHVSVLLQKSVEALDIKPNGIYVDATAGGGGHSEAILKKLGPKGRLIAIDQDSEAIEACRARLTRYSDKLTLVKSNFSRLKEVLESLSIEGVDGILMDLGVSSHQLDVPERGFSYNIEAPLDMRMDKEKSLTAYEIVNSWPQAQIARILVQYGEERFAGRIAGEIVREREKGPITSTTGLAEIIKRAIPAAARREGPHPARRSFQALRIAVNGELDILEDSLKSAVDMLNPGGRLAVITFHSLEDRIVKNVFSDLSSGCRCPKSFPVCVCNQKPKVRVITRKPIIPDDEEIKLNARSRSAKLRVVQACDQV